MDIAGKHGCAYFKMTGDAKKSQGCDNGCEICLKAYFLKRGQENIDMQR